MRKWPVLMAAVLVAAAASGQPAAGPDGAPANGATIGFMHAIHATERVEATLAFYRAVFGLEAEVRPFANPGVELLTDSPGASLRIAMLRIPGEGLGFELTEFQNVEREMVRPSVVDVGAPHMKILVRDLSPVVAALDARNASIATRTMRPVRVRTTLGEVEAIFFRDPDGYYVEAVQVADAPAGDGNVVGAIMGLTVEDLDASLAFWNGQLGFELERDAEFSQDPAVLDLFGLKGDISYRTAHGKVPGSNVRFELIEFRNVFQDTFDRRIPDSGSAGMAIRVADIEKLLPALRAAGGRVVSKDGRLVEWSPTVRNAFVKDPNGFNIEIVGAVASQQ